MFGHQLDQDPPSNFGLDVKTYDTTHALRRYEKIYYSYNETFWEEQGTIQNWI